MRCIGYDKRLEVANTVILSGRRTDRYPGKVMRSKVGKQGDSSIHVHCNNIHRDSNLRVSRLIVWVHNSLTSHSFFPARCNESLRRCESKRSAKVLLRYRIERLEHLIALAVVIGPLRREASSLYMTHNEVRVKPAVAVEPNARLKQTQTVQAQPVQTTLERFIKLLLAHNPTCLALQHHYHH